MSLTRAEERQLRALAADLRLDAPHVARALLPGPSRVALRVALAVVAMLAGVVLLAIGTPAACVGAGLLDLAAVLSLRSIDDHA